MIHVLVTTKTICDIFEKNEISLVRG